MEFNSRCIQWLFNGSIKTIIAIFVLTPLLDLTVSAEKTNIVRFIGLVLILGISVYNRFFKESTNGFRELKIRQVSVVE